jgi:hypothetical protein
MSTDFYEDDCEGCQPMVLDPKTGTILPDTDPLLQKMRAEFKKATRQEKMAWHNVTCSNSRDPEDLKIAGALVVRMQS